MAEKGLWADFSPGARRELEDVSAAFPSGDGWQDLTARPWCSIDNDDSRDLDQLTVAEPAAQGGIRVAVAIADVDAIVKRGGGIDGHAAHNTTTVYTPARNFPMLPTRLSEDLTSLGQGEDRAAIVVQFTVGPDGECRDEDVCSAVVRNQAKLAYPSTGDWLAGAGPLPGAAQRVPGMDEQLRLQDSAAQALRRWREAQGALDFEDRDAGVTIEDGKVVELRVRPRNRASELIENFMITANGVVTRHLRGQGLSTIQRVVRSPERWEQLVDVAAERGWPLPPRPDGHALQEFLTRQRSTDPVTFPDLSLTVIKLLGRGEYTMVSAQSPTPGHFGLAVRDYAHSTAPNRRYPDLVTQRLLKADLDGSHAAYDAPALAEIATHCSEMEVAAEKIERRLRKSAAALMLEDRLGDQFDAIVTGASAKGTWARVLTLPVEGKVVRGARGLRVGQRIRVRLLHTDAAAGFIDWARA